MIVSPFPLIALSTSMRFSVLNSATILLNSASTSCGLPRTTAARKDSARVSAASTFFSIVEYLKLVLHFSSMHNNGNGEIHRASNCSCAHPTTNRQFRFTWLFSDNCIHCLFNSSINEIHTSLYRYCLPQEIVCLFAV